MNRQRDFSGLAPLFFLVLSCFASHAYAACGNGKVEAGEDCDDGTSNGTTNSCCDVSCHFNGHSPDVVVGDLTGSTRWGTVGGISAYSVGTNSCNYGSCWLNWISTNAEHPVIGQNMYRLKDGRFEQVGQSWLKHGYFALQHNACFDDCVAVPDGTHLGIHCSDLYDDGLNGEQTRLGPKDDVNAFTGVFPFPDSRESTTGNAIFKRLQIHDTDIDPTLNPGALYFVEGQYVSHDDATANNNTNNASYRPCTFTGTTTFTMTLTGSTVRQQAGIQAWKAQDPSVTEVIVDAPEGRFILSAKATSLGGGVWHYEYALQNLTNQRAGKSFTVPIPTGTTVSNVGFHDVDYHSGTPYEGTDWTPTIASTTVSWAMAVAANPANSNALRWGTLYNFRFDANVAPGAADVTIGLWRAGQPTTKTAHTVVPNPCLSAPDGTVCDDSNACTISDHCTGGVCAGTGPLLPDDVGNGVTVSQASGVTTISWTPAPNSASTSVLRGSVAQLPVGPGGDDEVCLDPNNAGSSTVDPENPPVDGGYWYLVRGVNACGVGTYGYEEDAGAQGPARQSTTCP